VTDDLIEPNGITGTPDGKTLYVADHRGKKCWAYSIGEDGRLADKRLFCEMGFGTDGMTVDADGRVQNDCPINDLVQ
jgi:gluconolactonase